MEQSSQTRGPRARRPWTEEDQRRAEELRAQGLSFRDIGERLGASHTTIIRRLDPQAFHRHTDRMREWRAKNPDAMREMARRWRAENPDMRSPEKRREEYLRARARMSSADRARRSNQRRARYLANRRLELEKSRCWRLANPEKAREKSRRWREANPEKRRAVERAWTKANPEKCREKTRRQHARRRSARRLALVPAKIDHVQMRFALFRNRCAYCGCISSLTVDHVLALKAGGLDEATNMVPACRSCNSKKRATPVADWYLRQPFFSEARWRLIQRHCPGAAGQLSLAVAPSTAA